MDIIEKYRDYSQCYKNGVSMTNDQMNTFQDIYDNDWDEGNRYWEKCEKENRVEEYNELIEKGILPVPLIDDDVRMSELFFVKRMRSSTGSRKHIDYNKIYKNC